MASVSEALPFLELLVEIRYQFLGIKWSYCTSYLLVAATFSHRPPQQPSLNTPNGYVKCMQ